MNTWIALFRGINVGGHNKLPMAELRDELESLELENVQTYIQSGNVVFQALDQGDGALEDEIAAHIEATHGFRPRVLVLDAQDLRSAMDANPFPEADAEPKTVHLYFLAGRPSDPNLAALEDLRSASERFELADRVLYLYTPDGYGTSSLASSIERHLGVEVTARNWRTVSKLREMADDSGP